jgi:heat-inducible transcriptional repressor
MLTARQEVILCKVVEGYRQTGQPVASRTIAADPALRCGPSTVRNELTLLEQQGLLAHPHVSSGRVPTDAGQRYVVDHLPSSGQSLTLKGTLQLTSARQEVEDAMRSTTEALSQVNNLLAVVSAPSLQSATIRHIELLALQPQVVVVVIITSTGGVSKTLATFAGPVDPGLLSWASEYLNERLAGVGLGTRMLHQRIVEPSLSATELAFLERLFPAFGGLGEDAEEALYVEGTSRLLSAHQVDDVAEINELIDLLERRVALLEVLRAALGAPDVYVRIGQENELPAMRSFALVATGYGVARRKLGAVSVIGPVCMDYAGAISTVREAAQQLSRLVETTYAER